MSVLLKLPPRKFRLISSMKRLFLEIFLYLLNLPLVLAGNIVVMSELMLAIIATLVCWISY